MTFSLLWGKQDEGPGPERHKGPPSVTACLLGCHRPGSQLNHVSAGCWKTEPQAMLTPRIRHRSQVRTPAGVKVVKVGEGW